MNEAGPHRRSPVTDFYERGGEAVAGRMKSSEGAPHWRTFFAVEDLDAALARLGPLEGKLLEGPIVTPYGPVARVADPYGAVFLIMQLAR